MPTRHRFISRLSRGSVGAIRACSGTVAASAVADSVIKESVSLACSSIWVCETYKSNVAGDKGVAFGLALCEGTIGEAQALAAQPQRRQSDIQMTTGSCKGCQKLEESL